MPRFFSGLLASDYFQFDPFPYLGKGWKVELSQWPKSQPFHKTTYGSKSYLAKEVVISAGSRRKALEGLRLIMQAAELWQGSLYFTGPASFYGDITLRDRQERRIELAKKTEIRNSSWPNIPWSCLIAAKASHRRSTAIALAKWRISCELCSVAMMDQHPSKKIIAKSPYLDDQVRLAQSIVVAYSIIEELGLEVRASNDNPSSIDGVWNPVVKQDLESRLAAAGVDLV